MTTTTVHGDGRYSVTSDDGDITIACANGYVARVVSAVIEENYCDAQWAAEILNAADKATHPAEKWMARDAARSQPVPQGDMK